MPGSERRATRGLLQLLQRFQCGWDHPRLPGDLRRRSARRWRGSAQLVQAAVAGGADAAGRDAQPGADLGVGHGRVGGQQGEQPLAVRGPVPGLPGAAPRDARPSAAPALRWWLAGPGGSPGPAGTRRPAVPGSCAVPGRIPAGWWWPASREARPGVGACQGGRPGAARRSGRRRRRRRPPADAGGRWTRSAGVSLDQRVPCLLVAVPGPGHQFGDRLISALGMSFGHARWRREWGWAVAGCRGRQRAG